MPFEISEHIITAGGTRHVCLVVTPRAPMVIRRERLAALRASTGVNEVEKRILRECAARQGRCHVSIFRGITLSGEVGWSFDESFDEDELAYAGYVMTRALLPLHRRMLSHEIALFIHSEWGERECIGMRRGVADVIAHLEGGPLAKSPETKVDLWILKNMLFHFALPLERISEAVLPPHLRMIASRLPRLRGMIETLPKESIEY